MSPRMVTRPFSCSTLEQFNFSLDPRYKLDETDIARVVHQQQVALGTMPLLRETGFVVKNKYYESLLHDWTSLEDIEPERAARTITMLDLTPFQLEHPRRLQWLADRFANVTVLRIAEEEKLSTHQVLTGLTGLRHLKHLLLQHVYSVDHRVRNGQR